jgi:hypothetical protein
MQGGGKKESGGGDEFKYDIFVRTLVNVNVPYSAQQ